MNKTKDENEPNVTLEGPDVNLEIQQGTHKKVQVKFHPFFFEAKLLYLKMLSPHLKNCIVAYDNLHEYKIETCIDILYHSNDDLLLKKATGLAKGYGFSCCLHSTVPNNNIKGIVICSLIRNIWLKDIITNDDFSSEYGGLTRLYTLGKGNLKNLELKYLFTSDGFLLEKRDYPMDFVENNQFFWARLNYLEKHTLINIISSIESDFSARNKLIRDKI